MLLTKVAKIDMEITQAGMLLLPNEYESEVLLFLKNELP
jgi:hypothetical protein